MISHFSTYAFAQDLPNIDETVKKTYVYCMKQFPDIPSENIKVRKKEQLIPLTTIPSPWNLFRKQSNWKYSINISTKTISRLSPILYDSLSKEGQIGVLSHELSHVSDFHSQGKGYLVKIFFSHLSKKKMDAFEFNTDLITIQKGMGKYLLAWSTDVREKLNIADWKGKETFTDQSVSERYMSPATICQYLSQMPEIYPSLPKNCTQDHQH